VCSEFLVLVLVFIIYDSQEVYVFGCSLRLSQNVLSVPGIDIYRRIILLNSYFILDVMPVCTFEYVLCGMYEMSFRSVLLFTDSKLTVLGIK